MEMWMYGDTEKKEEEEEEEEEEEVYLVLWLHSTLCVITKRFKCLSAFFRVELESGGRWRHHPR